MNKKIWSVAVIVPLAAAAAVATAPSAGAVVEPRDAATARAACSDLRSQVMLTGRVNLNNRIVLRLRLTTQRPRPAWDVRIARVNPNLGVNIPISETREFTAREGLNQQRSFEVVARTINRPGPDRFVARAVHVFSGETCRVAITVRGNNAEVD